MPQPTISRRAGRVVLIDSPGRVLMLRGGDPCRPERGSWWFTPGGGADAGETTFEAARRELREETGQVDLDWGVLVARRSAIFEFMGSIYRQEEDYYVAHTASSEVKPESLTDIERDSVYEHRWLDAGDLASLSEPVHPVELPGVLPGLSRRHYPNTPWSWAT